MEQGFGKRVREVRTSRGLTQQDFADSLGLSKQTIANVENGQQGFSLEVLEVLHGQGVDLNWLIAGTAKD
jgi:transcriptional regulator with XRE-family HTH domain